MPLFPMDYLLKYSAIHGKYRNAAMTAMFNPNTAIHVIAFKIGLFSILLIKFFMLMFLMLEFNI